ncbi:hypothetical protein AC057_16795 [Acinetobacter genomosp. 33YU]|nr:hypothetical protein AC057_16795 [Acinetobacter genomosp. 33YU]
MAEEDHLVAIVIHLVVIITLQKVNYPMDEVAMGVLVVALLVIVLPNVLVVGQIIVLGLVEGLTVLHQVVIKNIDNQ